jgi:hypothetical protein
MIRFTHYDLTNAHMIRSPQLPGRAAYGITRVSANANCAARLREYITMRSDVPPVTRTLVSELLSPRLAQRSAVEYTP